MISDRKFSCVALAGALFFLLAYYAPWLLGQRSFYQSDLSYYFEPLCHFFGETVRAGRLPLWNPYLWCGMSQIAVASPSWFYPLNWLFALTPNFSQSLALYLILHQLIAGVGMFLLARRLGVSAVGALVAAIVATLNGYVFSATTNFTLIASAAWIPLAAAAVLSIKGAFNRANIVWVIVAAFASAMMVGAGRPEIFGPACAVLAGLAIFAGKNKEALRSSAFGVAALACGFLLAMVVLAPVFEWWPLSYRAYGLQPKSILTWSANWYDWVCMFFVQPYGDLGVIDAPLRALVNSRNAALPYIQSAYVGAIPATLAIISLFGGLKEQRCRWWILGIALVAVVLASGENTPVAPYLVTHFPLVDLVRYPVKLLIFPVYCLALLSALGFDAIVERRVSLLAIGVTSIVWIAAAVLGGMFRFSSDVFPVFFSIPLPEDFVPITERLLDAQSMLGRSLLSGALFGLGLCFFCGTVLRNDRAQQIFKLCIPIATAGSLALAAFLFPPVSSAPDFFSKPSPLADWLRPKLADKSGHDIYRLLPLYFESASRPPKYTQGGTDVATYRLARAMLFENQASDFKIPVESGYEGSPTGRFLILNDSLGSVSLSLHDPNATPAPTNDGVLAHLCKFTAAKYISMPMTLGHHERLRPVAGLDARWFDRVYQSVDDNLAIYACRNTNERFSFARGMIWVQDWSEFFNRFGRPNPLDRFDDFYVRGEGGIGAPKCVPLAMNETDDTITCEASENEYLRLRTHTTKDRLLVVADTHYPGWVATIDGRETYMYKANVFFRAVSVPPGDHTVEMRYQPTSLIVGLMCTALGLLILLGAWFKAARKP